MIDIKKLDIEKAGLKKGRKEKNTVESLIEREG
jgi:hypothetical protein